MGQSQDFYGVFPRVQDSLLSTQQTHFIVRAVPVHDCGENVKSVRQSGMFLRVRVESFEIARVGDKICVSR